MGSSAVSLAQSGGCREQEKKKKKEKKEDLSPALRRYKKETLHFSSISQLDITFAFFNELIDL